MEAGGALSSGPPVPSVGKRLLSTVYEALLAFAVAFLAGLAFTAPPRVALPEQAACSSRSICSWCSGYIRRVLEPWGRTLPMQTWRMRLVRRDGGRVEVGRAALRYGLAWLSLLVFGAGFVWAWVDRDRQFLHDRLAGTRIVTR